jgi:hypothetical protein
VRTNTHGEFSRTTATGSDSKRPAGIDHPVAPEQLVEQIFFTFDEDVEPGPKPDDSFAMTDVVVKTDGRKVFIHVLNFSDPIAAEGHVYGACADFRSVDPNAARRVEIAVKSTAN